MAEERIFQVSEFNEFINGYLYQVGEVVIEGEISQINVSQNRWLFVTIKDKESSVEVFSTTQKISGYDLLEQGMLVRVYGSPGLYKKSGRFSIRAEQIVPAGEGALRLAFEKLKLKLETERLFDFQRKRQLPVFPEKIGIITAKDSRAYSDFIKCLKERMGGLNIFFYPVSVQGEGSVNSIVQAFKYFNNNLKDLDVLVLTRGGGSLEDLQSFNDERVARAIFSSKIPVVCGVGHEEDISIADLVADIRASTPSNAAELIVRSRADVMREVNYGVRTIENCLKRLIKDKNDVIFRSISTLKSAIAHEASKIHRTINRFNTRFTIFAREVQIYKGQVSSTRIRLTRATDFWISQQKTSLNSLVRLMENINPYRLLEKGFSITTDKNGAVLKSIKNVKNGESIVTRLFDGKISSQVLTLKIK